MLSGFSIAIRVHGGWYVLQLLILYKNAAVCINSLPAPCPCSLCLLAAVSCVSCSHIMYFLYFPRAGELGNICPCLNNAHHPARNSTTACVSSISSPINAVQGAENKGAGNSCPCLFILFLCYLSLCLCVRVCVYGYMCVYCVHCDNIITITGLSFSSLRVHFIELRVPS